ncbi:MAG: sigma-70 family RNA polymerase sigma factor [Planctomycetota bacterium]|nr:sigma-70 family RNA polymerase sigma factor [Planctomycetota bacterium]
MARIEAGDEQAFDSLVDRHRKGVLNFYYRLTWDRDLAEDLAQEVFIRLFTHRGRYEATARFTTYLYRIAHNCWIDHLRKTRQERKLRSLDAGGEDGAGLRESVEAMRVEAPPEGAGKEEYSEAVIAAIESLPEDQKVVFVLSEVQGMRYAEIAETLGIPEGTVKSRMHHAVNRLRERLSRLGKLRLPGTGSKR